MPGKTLAAEHDAWVAREASMRPQRNAGENFDTFEHTTKTKQLQ